jgi:alpha-galactosidase
MLAEWAGEVAAAVGCGRLRSLPAGWCSWYCYERLVTEELVLRQVRLASELRLPIEVFLVDEGYEVALGDWLIERDGFGELARLARTVRAEGKVPGLWLAPFVVAAESGIARAHPEWLLVGVDAGHVWGSDLLVVDSWNDEAVAHVVEVFVRLVEMGFGLFKLDFLYAGLRGGGSRSVTALEDVDGYRRLLSSIRKAIGPEPYLLGCGAPLFASIGLFDSMRVSCDVGVHWGEPAGYLDGRPTEVWYPSGVRAVRSGAARAFAHGVWWVNDPDCLIARPEMEQRECWAKYLEASGGMRFSGDALEDLDPWGLDTARLLLRGVSPAPLSDSALVAVDQLGRELRPRA